MNKKFIKFFEERNLRIEGNNAYGELRGFDVSFDVKVMDPAFPVKLTLQFYADDETKQRIGQKIFDLKIKYFTFGLGSNGIFLGFNDLTINKLFARFDLEMEKIILILKEEGVKGIGYCPICGKELVDEGVVLDDHGFKFRVDEECHKMIVASIQHEEQQKENSPTNYGKGFLGACGGALLGCIIFTIVFFFGFISAIVAVLTVYLAQKFYVKMQGKEDKIMLLICSVVSLLFTVINYFALYLFAATALVSEYGFNSTGIEAFSDMMTIDEFSTEFVTNLSMTIGFTVLGILLQVSAMNKKMKMSKPDIKVSK